MSKGNLYKEKKIYLLTLFLCRTFCFLLNNKIIVFNFNSLIKLCLDIISLEASIYSINKNYLQKHKETNE